MEEENKKNDPQFGFHAWSSVGQHQFLWEDKIEKRTCPTSMIRKTPSFKQEVFYLS